MLQSFVQGVGGVCVYIYIYMHAYEMKRVLGPLGTVRGQRLARRPCNR